MSIRRLERYNAKVLHAALCLLLLSTLPIGGYAKLTSDQVNAELQQDISQLESLRQSGNLYSLEVIVNRNSVKWRKREQKQFVKYMFQVCSLLSSYDVGDTSKRALLLSQYATSLLRSGKLTTEENIQFVEFLTLDPPVMDERAWAILRERKARLWLAAWRRVAGSINPTFNFDDRPLLNVLPPLATGLPAGVSPESIKDPKLRAEYEAAIADNSAKAQRYSDQQYLKQNAARFFAEAERYLVSAYSRSPLDLPELNGLLTAYVGDPVVRKRVLDEVGGNRGRDVPSFITTIRDRSPLT